MNDNRRIVVCSFMPNTSGPMSTYRPCSTNYMLYVGNNAVQLFAKQRGDTFVFINRPPEASGDDVITSIALQKISVPVQRVGCFLRRFVLHLTRLFMALANRKGESIPSDRD